MLGLPGFDCAARLLQNACKLSTHRSDTDMKLMLPSHPQLSSAPQRRFAFLVTALRALIFVVALLIVRHLTDLSTSALTLIALSGMGVYGGTLLAFSRLRIAGIAVASAGATCIYLVIRWIVINSPELIVGTSFSLLSWLWRMDVLGIILVVTALSTVCFWRFRWVATAEALSFAAVCITTFSTHRNFRLDMPRVVNDISWYWGIAPLSALIVLGASALGIIVAYFFSASAANRPVASLNLPEIFQARTRASKFATIFVSLVATATLVLIGTEIYRRYNLVAGSRLSNGVGQADSSGLSPLDFHSALGSTNQPSALLRLEGDYSGNPFSPMMYLRESALSEFDGKQMVIAPPGFDLDVPRLQPEQAFFDDAKSPGAERTPVMQSVYLLADHKLAFALDFPVRFDRLKNPNPTRFKSSYRAESFGPAFPLSDLPVREVGDPTWSAATREHYLATHPDSRYAEMAQRITDAHREPLSKANAIVQYLNATTIYTLTPKHEVAAGEDPVAPYLFGDMRGYCVHFAHAMVYMFRSLGIPARIGTGYLTDLSQARDGHVLLRMSDRHAWSEIYVRDIGWVPFDLQPEQVESHADTEVDMKLLEELMGMIDPADEILPPTKNDEQGEGVEGWSLPSARSIALGLLCLLAALAATKVWLLERWRIASHPSTRLRWWHISVALQLCDMGVSRTHAETRSEFRQRASSTLGNDVLTHTELLLKDKYSSTTPNLADTTAAIQVDRSMLRRYPRWLRIAVYMSPYSLLRRLLGHSL